MPLPQRLPSAGRSTLVGDKAKEILANRYQVERSLGSGNCGTALLVTDFKEKNEKEKLKVAKKIFVGNLQPDETVDASHEASLLRNLNHPGIVKFYDSFVEAEFFCIITEYCEGGDLDSKITDYQKNKKTFPEPQVMEWIIEILLALQYMHSRKILHRDLKTRNIFLHNGRCQIGDLGISRILMGSSDMASTFVGTPYYMSPEVLKHEGYNSKSDIWSVGCILYDLVALEHPFQGTTLMGVMYKITEGDPPPWPEEYSEDLQELFLLTLEKDPLKRPSATDALHLPFVSRQFEMMKSTLIEKHRARESNELIGLDTEQIANAFSNSAKFSDLKRESENKKYRNLLPRERMRIEKQQKADENFRRLQEFGTKQCKENDAKRHEISRKNNPYESTLAGEAYVQNDSPTHQHASSPGRDAYNHRPPHTLPTELVRYLKHVTESDETGSSSDEYDDVVDPPPRRPTKQNAFTAEKGGHNRRKSAENDNGTNYELKKARSLDKRPATMASGQRSRERSDSDSDERSRTLTEDWSSHYQGAREERGGYRRSNSNRSMGDEDRPITPMKDRMVYNLRQSSLDFEDGIPETPELAETYYEQFQDDFRSDDDDSEVLDMMTNLQSVLNTDQPLTQTLVVDDMQAGAFGPGAKKIKIRNLRKEAVRKLGTDKFRKVYDYLKRARFDDRVTGQQIDEKRIMGDLKKITQSSDDCYLVEQLLFLQYQQRERR